MIMWMILQTIQTAAFCERHSIVLVAQCRLDNSFVDSCSLQTWSKWRVQIAFNRMQTLPTLHVHISFELSETFTPFIFCSQQVVHCSSLYEMQCKIYSKNTIVLRNVRPQSFIVRLLQLLLILSSIDYHFNRNLIEFEFQRLRKFV